MQALDIISQKIEDLTKDFEKENKELKILLSACVKYTSPKVAVSKIAVCKNVFIKKYFFADKKNNLNYF